MTPNTVATFAEMLRAGKIDGVCTGETRRPCTGNARQWKGIVLLVVEAGDGEAVAEVADLVADLGHCGFVADAA